MLKLEGTSRESQRPSTYVVVMDTNGIGIGASIYSGVRKRKSIVLFSIYSDSCVGQ